MKSPLCAPIPIRGHVVSRKTDMGCALQEGICHRVCMSVQDGDHSQMERAAVSGLKNSLRAYLRKVRASHSVVAYDRLALLAAQGIRGR